MLPFSRQIQLACDFAGKSCARLTHSEVPTTPDTEKSFDELKQRLAKTIDYVKTFKPAQFEGADARDVTFPVGPDQHDAEGPAVRSAAMPSRISTSTPPSPTASCATTAWKSESGIFSG